MLNDRTNKFASLAFITAYPATQVIHLLWLLETLTVPKQLPW